MDRYEEADKDEHFRRIRELCDEHDRKVMQAILMFLLGIIIGALVITWAVASTEASADPLRARLVHARGDNGLTAAQAKSMFLDTLAQIRMETGLDIRLARFESVRNPYQRLHGNFNANAVTLLYQWVRWFNNRHSQVDIRFVSVPPFKVSGRYWLLGYAQQCQRRGTGYATGEMFNERGEARLATSQVAMHHELLHVVGARHLETDCNIMSYGALGCASTPTLLTTVQQVKSCAGRW